MKVLLFITLPLLRVNCKLLVFDNIRIFLSENLDSNFDSTSYTFSGNKLMVQHSFTKAQIVKQNIRVFPKDSVTDIDWVRKIIFKNTGTTKIQSEAFTKLPKLQLLEIRENSIKSLPPNVFICPNLDTLIFSDNQMEELDDQAFAHLPNLKTLDLSRNRLKRVEPTTFQYVPKMKHLDLSGNGLTHLPDTTFRYLNKFPDMILLKNNGMRVISHYAFPQDVRIENLVLDENKLIDVDLTRLRGVIKLNITRNSIMCQDAQLVKKVVYFYADQNPWKCDCIKKFLNEKDDRTDIWAPNAFQKCGMRQYRFKYYPF